MKKKILIIILGLSMLVTGCTGLKKAAKEMFLPKTPAKTLLEQAESAKRQGDTSKAFVLYSDFIKRYPQSEDVPAVLMKMAAIRFGQKRYNEARSLYERIWTEYPESFFAGQARVEYLHALEAEGRYDVLIAKAKEFLVQGLSEPFATDVRLLIGDAWIARGDFSKAYQVYKEAFLSASGQVKQQAGRRLMDAAANLPGAFIEDELGRLKGAPPSGYLEVAAGIMAARKGDLLKAAGILSSFIGKHPDHPLVSYAEKRLDAIRSKSPITSRTIGCLLPLSGRYGSFGQQALRGLELALSDASEQAGNNMKFRILVRDTAANDQATKVAVNELREKGAAAIVGPLVAVESAAAEAQKAGVPIIVLTQKQDITEKGGMVFQNFLTPDMQVKALVSYTSGELNIHRYAVLYPDEPYGRRFLFSFWDTVIDYKGRIMGAESYQPDHTDFQDQIRKLVGLYYDIPESLRNPVMEKELFEALLNGGMVDHPLVLHDEEIRSILSVEKDNGVFPDVTEGETKKEEEKKPEPIIDFEAVFIPDIPEKAGLIIPQLRYYDIKDVYLLGTNLWYSDSLIRIAGRQLQKALIPVGFFAGSRNRKTREFVSSFKNIYGYTPGFIEAVAYDTGMILFSLLSDPACRSRIDLAKALKDFNGYNGVCGFTRFGPTGACERSITLLTVRNGRFREIERDIHIEMLSHKTGEPAVSP